MNRLIIALAVLTGCGHVEESSDRAGQSGEAVEQNERFTLVYTDVIEGPIMEEIEQEWLEVQTCIGVAMPDPELTIEYVPLSEMPVSQYGWNMSGYIKYKPRYIRVNNDDRRTNYALRHEFVHWILYQLGESDYDLENHLSPFYVECLV